MDKNYALYCDRCRALSMEPTEDVLFVSIGEQKLSHYHRAILRKHYTISTSRRPPSCVENSLGTPTGLHRIDEKIGHDAPLGMVFKGRQPQGVCYQSLSSDANVPNLITTRILWLRGLELGHNAGAGIDTHDRYVYIHGTNHEERLGTPDSHGCVLMNNREIIELFDSVASGTHVYIS